jgi:glycosyltransferase involved in cell wall biosynthesis
MKKIAVLYSGGRQWGGIETYLANLFKLYDRKQMELTLISLGEWDLTRAFRREGLSPLITVFSGRRIRFRTILDLRRLIKAEHVGLIVSHGTVANAYARLAALAARIPSLVVVHSDMTLDYPSTTRWAFKLSDRLLRSLTTKYVAVSWNLKTKMVKSGIDGDRITVIYNGVNASGRMARAERVGANALTDSRPDGPSLSGETAARERVISLASVGRLHPVKNFDSLISAMSLLPARVHLTVWGDGGEKQRLLALVDRLGIGDRVALPGESQSMTDALDGVDIYVQPSKSEGFGFAVAEAMLHGKPVVVTPCGGLPEQVDDGMTGLVAADWSPQALAKAILPLVSDRSLAVKLGKAGRRAAQKKCSMQKWLTETTKALCDTALGDT